MITIAQIANYLWLLFLAAFGGLFNYLIESRQKGIKPNFYDGFLKTLGSAFTGVVAIYGCLAFDLSPYWMGVIVGISGWGGSSLLEFCVGLAKKKAEAWVQK
jgi:hypothetical protein